ncbi:hypothetical protein BC940DRAFT_310826 [Gongronella butleri]|nr:hypothetical protein BC940DRAFT_310826 [Gongronella butleri]
MGALKFERLVKHCSGDDSAKVCSTGYNNDNAVDDVLDMMHMPVSEPIVADVDDQQPLGHADLVPAARTTFPYTIVTASSANHLCSLENFLYSLYDLRGQVPLEQFPRIVVYDIGMNRTQLPILDQLKRHGLVDDVVQFNYFEYPRFWDVAINAGEYAWKTGIVNEARQVYGGTLVWLDSGNMVTANFLKSIPTIVKEQGGFWSPRSQHTMGRWTHRGMFDYFGVQMQDYARNINCNGAAVAFDTTNQHVVDNIMLPWYQCGLDKNCIAPPGSSRLNHRQDQAALTLLVYRAGFQCLLPPGRFQGLQIHRDSSCRASLLDREVRGNLFHPSAIDFPKWYRSDTLELYNHPEWRYPEDKVPEHIKDYHRSRL